MGNTGNPTPDGEFIQTTFDTNLVIIMVALLCALICALGLNSMVRCVRRCCQCLRPPETVDPTAAAVISPTGMKKSALRKIPILLYESSENENSGKGMNNSECAICLGEFMAGDKIRVLPKCCHGFHVRCIDTWLQSNSSCPNCRHSLVDVISSSKAAAVRLDGGCDASLPPRPPPQHGGSDGGGGLEHVVVVVNEGR